MILKALCDYYDRKSELGEIAPMGFEEKRMPFLVLIDWDGNFVGLQDTREDKKDKGRKFLVPQSRQRSGSKSYASPNLLWDHCGFVLGRPKDGSPKALEDARKQSECFFLEVCKLAQNYPKNRSFSAVRKFLSNPGRLAEAAACENWAECDKIASCNVTFKISGEPDIVCSDPDVRDYVEKSADSGAGANRAVCLVTGARAEVAVTHSGVTVGNQSGVRLVSFQKNSGYDSYCKSQGENAPISKSAETKYTTSLRTMLATGSKNRSRLGNLNVIYWGERETEIESYFGAMFSNFAKDSPDASAVEMKNLLDSVRRGVPPHLSNTRFYVLGLEANKARMVVRFWHNASVGEIGRDIEMHFRDFDIVRHHNDAEALSVINILGGIAFDAKAESLPPKLWGEFIKSAVSGAPYPRFLQTQCLNRIRVDRRINRIRAAILKAYLNRKNRINGNEREIQMSLDAQNGNIGYLCGRLFAVLEKIQKEAVPGANSTIVDRYYGSASTTPSVVFGRLMDLSNHHLSKIGNPGRVVSLRKKLGEVFDKIPASGFPPHLALDDQSRFAIGYYHQTRDFFNKSENSEQK